MSQENVEVVRAIFERWNAGDRTVAQEYLDPAVEAETPFSSVSGTPYRGYAGSSSGYVKSTSSSLNGRLATTTCVRSATR